MPSKPHSPCPRLAILQIPACTVVIALRYKEVEQVTQSLKMSPMPHNKFERSSLLRLLPASVSTKEL